LLLKAGSGSAERSQPPETKNEALPVIAAAMVCGDTVTLSNVPDIGDVRSMLSIASYLGAKVSEIKDGTLTINVPGCPSSILPLEMSKRHSRINPLASALLGARRESRDTQPGGDTIGRRRLDTHFFGLQSARSKNSRCAMPARQIQSSARALHVL